jgi:hypothetical protein
MKGSKHLYVHALTILLLVVIVMMLVRPGSQGPVLVGGFTNLIADMVSFASA